MRSFYLRFKEEHYEQEERQIQLKKKALEQRNITFLYKVKKLKNNHMSKKEIGIAYDNKVEQLDQLQLKAQQLFKESFCLDGQDNEIDASYQNESQYSDQFVVPENDMPN